MKLNHIGICCNQTDLFLEQFRNTIGINSVNEVMMPQKGQRSCYVRFGENDDCLELMEPIGEGTVKKFLEKHGEGIHHLSFKVDDLETAIAAFENAGARIIGRESGIAFVHPKGNFGILFELVEDKKK